MPNPKGYTIVADESKKRIFDKLKRQKGTAYYRQGSFSDEIIWQNRRFVFPSPKKSVSDSMWVFRSVQSDVRHFLNYNRIKEQEKLPVNYWNPNFQTYKGKITATDLDHAYWRIAFLIGAITEKTYQKGLLIKDKSIRLAALANLSSSKDYQVVIDGIVTKKTISLKYDPYLHKVYNNIRFTCYSHMMTMVEMLGDEFICYKTDCIYYKDKKENRELVQLYLDSVSMEWKQLIEPIRPKKEELSDSNLITLQ